MQRTPVSPTRDPSPVLPWSPASAATRSPAPGPQGWSHRTTWPPARRQPNAGPAQVCGGPSTHRFLAAPKPPGKMAASWLAALSWARSVILPRAILADSVRTFLGERRGHSRLRARPGRRQDAGPRTPGRALSRGSRVKPRPGDGAPGTYVYALDVAGSRWATPRLLASPAPPDGPRRRTKRLKPPGRRQARVSEADSVRAGPVGGGRGWDSWEAAGRGAWGHRQQLPRQELPPWARAPGRQKPQGGSPCHLLPVWAPQPGGPHPASRQDGRGTQSSEHTRLGATQRWASPRPVNEAPPLVRTQACSALSRSPLVSVRTGR